MSDLKKIKTALISVYSKDGLKPLIEKLHQLDIKLISTGGTKRFIENTGIPVTAVEDLTGYPSILGGRVKTLHPKVFGGILGRQSLKGDLEEMDQYEIPAIDLVIVDLYPFAETVASTTDEEEIIEKIDIGGISLIRAAAKNYADVIIIPGREHYQDLLEVLNKQGGETALEFRKNHALIAFHVSSEYDTEIFKYFNRDFHKAIFKESIEMSRGLRYGENPHQHGIYYGDFKALFDQLHGKEISYNNLLDIDAAVGLIDEFDMATIAILKHNNACGIASRDNLTDAWTDALAGDPVSAFGGILIANRNINKDTAEQMNKIFFEVVIAPSFDEEALEIFMEKKNRIILLRKPAQLPAVQFRTALNGVLFQDKDNRTENAGDLTVVTKKKPSAVEIEDMLMANKIVKHSKSNTIVLVKGKQLIASGVGQTSRVDALKQAIEKATSFQFDLKGAVMASDAFFPFADSVEIAGKAGITSVIQPGGSIRDKDSIEYCDQNDMSMVFTGARHFKH